MLLSADKRVKICYLELIRNDEEGIYIIYYVKTI